jgi:hypothetical protein
LSKKKRRKIASNAFGWYIGYANESEYNLLTCIDHLLPADLSGFTSRFGRGKQVQENIVKDSDLQI